MEFSASLRKPGHSWVGPAPSLVRDPYCLLKLLSWPGTVPGARAGSSGHLSISRTTKGMSLPSRL